MILKHRLKTFQRVNLNCLADLTTILRLEIFILILKPLLLYLRVSKLLVKYVNLIPSLYEVIFHLLYFVVLENNLTLLLFQGIRLVFLFFAYLLQLLFLFLEQVGKILDMPSKFDKLILSLLWYVAQVIDYLLVLHFLVFQVVYLRKRFSVAKVQFYLILVESIPI